MKHAIRAFGWILLLWLGACSSNAPRQWLDSVSGATITAQSRPLVLAHDDFPSGVNVRDYAELGLFDINNAGDHQPYLALTWWSTVDRDAAALAQQAEAFTTITLWANDQPLVLSRLTPQDAIGMQKLVVFPLPSPNARVGYYRLNAAQLQALRHAHQLGLSPSGLKPGERGFVLWRGDLAQWQTFIAQLP